MKYGSKSYMQGDKCGFKNLNPEPTTNPRLPTQRSQTKHRYECSTAELYNMYHRNY